MTRVLHIINGDLYAGAERVQDLLALHLPDRGYEIGFVTLKQGLFAASRKAHNAPLFALGMRSRLDLGIVRALARTARREGYRLLHSHTPRSALIGALAATLAGIPLIHHVHGPTTQDTEQRLRNYRNSLVERLCVRKATRAVAVSDFAAGYARSLGVPRAKLRKVWNGVETPPERDAEGGTGSVTLGAVALFRPRKGVEVLIEALAKLAGGHGKRVRLLMVGGFETRAYEDQIKGLARSLGVADRIEWAGFTTDVDGMLRRMDLFVLPSLYGEGLPMVVLEAMALGLPIVSARVGGVAEAIEDRRHGLLVAPGDADALARSIETLLDDEPLRLRLGRQARQRQVEHFSAQAMAAGVAEVYDECLRNA